MNCNQIVVSLACPAGQSAGVLQQTPTVSIVVPIYNEEAVLPEFFDALSKVCAKLTGASTRVEVVLVNDGSSDRSWELICNQCSSDPDYVGVNLSRNFGHQLALAAGLESARGEVVVSMDADLQDPPEIIPRLLDAHRQGYDIVYATRADRGAEAWSKRMTAAAFYWLFEKISGVAMPRNTGDFRLMSRRALAELAKLRETHRFIRGLVPWLGFPQTQVIYDRGDRAAGSTHYSLGKMILLAFDGITSMSRAPLRLAYVLSLILFSVFASYMVYVLYCHFVLGNPLVPGWTSVMSAISIFGIIQLLLFGIIGEYIGRIYEQVKQRPLYIIKDTVRAEGTARSVVPAAPSAERVLSQLKP